MTATEILFNTLHELTTEISKTENLADKMLKLSQVKRIVLAIEATAEAGYKLEGGAWWANMSRKKDEVASKVANNHNTHSFI